jgi:hypothetical protein
VVHAGNQHALEGYEDNQTLAKDVVVERTKKLGSEKWREAALAQKGKLVGFGH